MEDWGHDMLNILRMQWIIFKVFYSYIPETCSWFPLHWELHSSPGFIYNIIILFIIFLDITKKTVCKKSWTPQFEYFEDNCNFLSEFLWKKYKVKTILKP